MPMVNDVLVPETEEERQLLAISTAYVEAKQAESVKVGAPLEIAREMYARGVRVPSS